MSLMALLTILTFLTLGISLLQGAIGGFYHPNATEANYGLKYLWIFELTLFVNWLFAVYVAIRDKTDSKLKKLSMTFAVFLFVVLTFFVLYAVPRSYHAEYYIGQEKYSIPWQYNPINGSKAPGGKYFVIHVSYPDLRGQYENPDNRYELTLAKYTIGEKEKVGVSLDDLCLSENECSGLSYASNTYFVDNGFIYHIHYQGETITFKNRNELRKFGASIVSLFDSFKQK